MLHRIELPDGVIYTNDKMKEEIDKQFKKEIHKFLHTMNLSYPKQNSELPKNIK